MAARDVSADDVELTPEDIAFLDFLAECAVAEVEEETNVLRHAAARDKMPAKGARRR